MPDQDVRIERDFLDFVDQLEQNLMLRVLPDEVAGLLHGIQF